MRKQAAVADLPAASAILRMAYTLLRPLRGGLFFGIPVPRSGDRGYGPSPRGASEAMTGGEKLVSVPNFLRRKDGVG